ncbi:MAG: hypothetical protein LBK06_03065 [Planctomycetaceae bacterium]|jgi:hypothetical protein|nr:hypothetical protein [Planctomycetaceae bacterium]
MKTITLEEYKQHFGIYVDESNFITDESRYGITSLLRKIIVSNPLITNREIHKRIIETLSPLNSDKELTTKFTDKCLRILQSLGEITKLYREKQQPVWTATLPRWIKLDENNAVLLGNVSDSDVKLNAPVDGYDIVRRFNPKQEQPSVPEISLKDELGEQMNCELLLAKKKNDLKQQPFESIEPVERKIRVVLNSGNFFGDPNKLSGRWRLLSHVADGIYLGLQRNQETQIDKRRRYLLVEKRGRQLCSLDLYNYEEWKCLLSVINKQKHRTLADDVIKFKIPMPDFLERRLRLFGSQQPKWEWKLVTSAIFVILKNWLPENFLV